MLYYERVRLELAELGPDRQDRIVELGALLQQEGRQAHQPVRGDDELGQALDQQARGRDGAGDLDHPDHRGVDWYQYNTKSLSGWVTKKNAFAKPAAYEVPDWGVMLLHLKPKG
jgi:hypothetical protein